MDVCPSACPSVVVVFPPALLFSLSCANSIFTIVMIVVTTAAPMTTISSVTSQRSFVIAEAQQKLGGMEARLLMKTFAEGAKVIKTSMGVKQR